MAEKMVRLPGLHKEMRIIKATIPEFVDIFGPEYFLERATMAALASYPQTLEIVDSMFNDMDDVANSEETDWNDETVPNLELSDDPILAVFGKDAFDRIYSAVERAEIFLKESFQEQQYDTSKFEYYTVIANHGDMLLLEEP